MCMVDLDDNRWDPESLYDDGTVTATEFFNDWASAFTFIARRGVEDAEQLKAGLPIKWKTKSFNVEQVD